MAKKYTVTKSTRFYAEKGEDHTVEEKWVTANYDYAYRLYFTLPHGYDKVARVGYARNITATEILEDEGY